LVDFKWADSPAPVPAPAIPAPVPAPAIPASIVAPVIEASIDEEDVDEETTDFRWDGQGDG
jgi:hypothetical protein